MAQKSTSAEHLDALFDESSDELDDYLDWATASRPDAGEGANSSANTLQVPHDLMRRIDHAAEQANVSREALAARLLAEGLDRAA